MHGQKDDSDDERDLIRGPEAPRSVDMGSEMPMSLMDMVTAFSGSDGTYNGWHGLSNSDLHACHFNASAVALGCLAVFTGAFLTAVAGAPFGDVDDGC